MNFHRDLSSLKVIQTGIKFKGIIAIMITTLITLTYSKFTIPKSILYDFFMKQCFGFDVVSIDQK